MPVQSQARPTVTPAAAGPTQAPAGSGGRLDRMQRTVGNQAVQERLGLGAPEQECVEGDGSEVADGVAGAQEAMRENTDNASIRVKGRLAKNAAFADADGNGLIGAQATTFEVGVSRSRVWASFLPEVLLIPGSALGKAVTGGIGLSKLSFDFKTGTPSLTYDLGLAGDLLDPFFGVRDEVERLFSDAVRGALPPELLAGGYDPYTDPMLPQRLAAVAMALTSSLPARPAVTGGRGLGADDLLARIDQPEIVAKVGAKAMDVPLDPTTRLRLGDGATLELTARLEGTMGDALTRPKLRELSLSTQQLTLENVDAGLLGGLELHEMTFGPDVSVRKLHYTLGAETALALTKAFAAMGRPGANAPADPPVAMQALREQIDAAARRELPELLRAQVRRVAGEMPGLPLAELLGPMRG